MGRTDTEEYARWEEGFEKGIEREKERVFKLIDELILKYKRDGKKSSTLQKKNMARTMVLKELKQKIDEGGEDD